VSSPRFGAAPPLSHADSNVWGHATLEEGAHGDPSDMPVGPRSRRTSMYQPAININTPVGSDADGDADDEAAAWGAASSPLVTSASGGDKVERRVTKNSKLLDAAMVASNVTTGLMRKKSTRRKSRDTRTESPPARQTAMRGGGTLRAASRAESQASGHGGGRRQISRGSRTPGSRSPAGNDIDLGWGKSPKGAKAAKHKEDVQLPSITDIDADRDDDDGDGLAHEQASGWWNSGDGATRTAIVVVGDDGRKMSTSGRRRSTQVAFEVADRRPPSADDPLVVASSREPVVSAPRAKRLSVVSVAHMGEGAMPPPPPSDDSDSDGTGEQPERPSAQDAPAADTVGHSRRSSTRPSSSSRASPATSEVAARQLAAADGAAPPDAVDGISLPASSRPASGTATTPPRSAKATRTPPRSAQPPKLPRSSQRKSIAEASPLRPAPLGTTVATSRGEPSAFAQTLAERRAKDTMQGVVQNKAKQRDISGLISRVRRRASESVRNGDTVDDGAASTAGDAVPAEFAEDPSAFAGNLSQVFDDVLEQLHIDAAGRDSKEALLADIHLRLTSDLNRAIAALSKGFADRAGSARTVRRALILELWELQQRREVNLTKLIDLLERKTGHHGWVHGYADDDVYLAGGAEAEEAATSARSAGTSRYDKSKIMRHRARVSSAGRTIPLGDPAALTIGNGAAALSTPAAKKPSKPPTALTAQQRHRALHQPGRLRSE
jgi:hypothetical protein